jgi:hypothetical protein
VDFTRNPHRRNRRGRRGKTAPAQIEAWKEDTHAHRKDERVVKPDRAEKLAAGIRSRKKLAKMPEEEVSRLSRKLKARKTALRLDPAYVQTVNPRHADKAKGTLSNVLNEWVAQYKRHGMTKALAKKLPEAHDFQVMNTAGLRPELQGAYKRMLAFSHSDGWPGNGEDHRREDHHERKVRMHTYDSERDYDRGHGRPARRGQPGGACGARKRVSRKAHSDGWTGNGTTSDGAKISFEAPKDVRVCRHCNLSVTGKHDIARCGITEFSKRKGNYVFEGQTGRVRMYRGLASAALDTFREWAQKDDELLAEQRKAITQTGSAGCSSWAGSSTGTGNPGSLATQGSTPKPAAQDPPAKGKEPAAAPGDDPETEQRGTQTGCEGDGDMGYSERLSEAGPYSSSVKRRVRALQSLRTLAQQVPIERARSMEKAFSEANPDRFAYLVPRMDPLRRGPAFYHLSGPFADRVTTLDDAPRWVTDEHDWSFRRYVIPGSDFVSPAFPIGPAPHWQLREVSVGHGMRAAELMWVPVKRVIPHPPPMPPHPLAGVELGTPPTAEHRISSGPEPKPPPCSRWARADCSTLIAAPAKTPPPGSLYVWVGGEEPWELRPHPLATDLDKFEDGVRVKGGREFRFTRMSLEFVSEKTYATCTEYDQRPLNLRASTQSPHFVVMQDIRHVAVRPSIIFPLWPMLYATTWIAFSLNGLQFHSSWFYPLFLALWAGTGVLWGFKKEFRLWKHCPAIASAVLTETWGAEYSVATANAQLIANRSCALRYNASTHCAVVAGLPSMLEFFDNANRFRFFGLQAFLGLHYEDFLSRVVSGTHGVTRGAAPRGVSL